MNAAQPNNWGALATLDDEKAIAELCDGTLMKEIAERYKCSKVAVYKRLSKHPEYPQAIKYQADSLVENALKQVMECDADTVNIARARFDACHKWAMSRHPEVWGPKAGGNITVDLGSALQLIAERMQGHTAAQQSAHNAQEVGIIEQKP